ncbi:MAG: FG-GAP-like repeat-containing protein [Pyrinomonadaceae bacterium]
MKSGIQFTDIYRVVNKTITRPGRKFLVLAAVIFLAAGYMMVGPTSNNSVGSQRPTDQTLPALSGNRAIAHLKESGQYESIQSALAAARYDAEVLAGNVSATNYANQLRSTFTPNGLQLESSAKGVSWQSHWRLQSLAAGDQTLRASSSVVRSTGNRITLHHRLSSDLSKSASHPIEVEEWFNNTPDGLEHGFIVPERLTGPGNLHLTMAIEGDLAARATAAGQTLSLVDQQGETVLNYESLKVWDANKSKLRARMRTTGGTVILEVEDAGAAYPLVIDPTFSATAKLGPNDGGADDRFGNSVAISGDTVVVGSPLDDIGANVDQGSAYIFVRGTNGLWSQQAKLTGTGAAAGDQFGSSVAISGDTVIVGAPIDNVGTNNAQGSVYIFVRSGAVWSQQQKIVASDGGTSDVFGDDRCVGISGNTVVVGSAGSEVGDNANEGAAYVYVRTGTTWSFQQKLTANGGAAQDRFGNSVAISGNNIVVGTAEDTVSGNADQGSASIFTRSGTTWTQQQELFASDGATNDLFGSSVDIDTGFLNAADVIIGASYDTVGGRTAQGSAYVFTRSGTNWSQQQKLTASDGEANDHLGNSVAISAGAVILGVDDDDVGANTDQGAAYIFRRSNGTTWSQRQKLAAFDGLADDNFGRSVALSGDTAVVGAFLDDVGATDQRGSEYVFALGSKPFDFDDDGKSDISVFRSQTATWYLLNSSVGFTAVSFGLATDQLAAGDYDGDGATDIAVYRGSAGTWYLLQSTAGFASVRFGQQGDIAFPADVDGDGKKDIRVFRPGNGTWYWLNSSNGQFNAVQFGAPGDLGIVGNFDGDKFADLAVYRFTTGSWYLLQTTAGFAGIQFGASGDAVVPGDYDGDGRTDIAVFRPETGAWYRLDSSTGQFVAIGFGQNGDIASPADYDGDGKTDLAVFRPSNGYWYLLQSSAGFSAVPFGISTDYPVPAQP